MNWRPIVKMVPSMRACMLSNISDETRLVQFDGQIVFAGVSESDPQRSRWLAVRDGQKFVRLLPSDREVVEIVGPYVIGPDVSSYVPSRLAPSANLQLFLRGTDTLIVLHPGSLAGWRVFDVNSGVSSSSVETDMGAFLRWRVGVPDAAGGISWLVEIN
jgi:hypothetical protein